MRGWWTAAGIGFLAAGVLEVLFFGLSVVGTLMGGLMSFGGLDDAFPQEAAFVGPLVFGIYGLWLLATGIAAPLHLLAGGAILMGRRPEKLVWAAIVASLVPAVTVYCAPTSLIAGGLGLVAMIKQKGAVG